MSSPPAEVYRDRRARFTTRRALWQGPVLPRNHPLVANHMRQALESFRAKMLEQYCAPNRMLEQRNNRRP